ncbi:MAG: hypothetical protein II283_06840 [Alistipes sp.]|nr:hypothetical protein [Alistipes sp.]
MATENDKIFILQSDVELLSQSHRWGSEPTLEAGGEASVSESVKDLMTVPKLELQEVDIDTLTKITSSDIVDKFLRTEHHRIVAEEGEVENEIVTSAQIDEEDDLVSEELAEVYLSQGLNDMAKETYRKLSLLNPEKSIYFAEIISKIESNN